MHMRRSHTGQATRCAPSVVFLDELDALAPARSTRQGTQDQVGWEGGFGAVRAELGVVRLFQKGHGSAGLEHWALNCARRDLFCNDCHVCMHPL
jgi:SpoVK/Ycf46/Vps4 family AAA+-type ATPase